MNGVHDLADALKFSAAFYANIVGMEYGAAYLFCKWVVEDGGKISRMH